MRPLRFNELQKSLNGISQKVLMQSLRSMEADGLIIRTVYAEVPPRVEYSLSELGETMNQFQMQWKSGEMPTKQHYNKFENEVKIARKSNTSTSFNDQYERECSNCNESI